MSKSNKGFLFVIGGAVLVGVAFATVYFLVLAPRAERSRVQQEVRDWGQSWAEARTCLVGETPRSADGYEAMILREAFAKEDLTPALTLCLEPIKKLRRGEGYNAGADVEAAWTSLRKVLNPLGGAQAWRTARTPNQSLTQLRRDLARRIPPVDEAYAELRRVAGLAAEPVGKSLPLLDLAPALTAEDGTELAVEDVQITGNTVAIAASVDSHRILTRYSGKDSRGRFPLSSESVASVDGAGWGMWLREEENSAPEIRAGAIDDRGNPSDEGVVIDTFKDEVVALDFAVGAGDTRVVIYTLVGAEPDDPYTQSPITLRYARSTDQGLTWGDKGDILKNYDGYLAAEATLALQRLDITWREPGKGELWLAVEPGTIDGPLTPTFVLPTGTASETSLTIRSPCAAGDLLWWQSDGSLYVRSPDQRGPSQPVPGSNNSGSALACAGKRAVSLGGPRDTGRGVLVCQASGCASTSIPALPTAHGVAAMSEVRGPLVAMDTDGILILWSGDPEEKKAFEAVHMTRLPEGHMIHGLIEWDGVLHLVTTTAASAHISPFAKSR